MRATSAAVLLALLATSCGDDDGGTNQNDNQNACPAGHAPDGPACVPIFDDPDTCGAPSEMPVLGGGCRAVGVTACATGFLSDGAGGCEPILPDHDCPPGTLERIGETECQPVGVTQCATGFLSDDEGGCDAILPPDECPPGTRELIGFDTCQPLGDCGPEESRWGLIPTDGTTVYVDASADATGADGTMAAPFPTITAALAAVEPGGQVAVAAGEYLESVVIAAPVRLEGRCASRVTVRGQLRLGQTRPALSIGSGGTGSRVRSLTLTGPGEGLVVSGARQVVVEDVEVRDAGYHGLVSHGGAEVEVQDSRVIGATIAGLILEDSTVRADRLVVRGTRSHPLDRQLGTGVVVLCSDAAGCGVLQLERSLLVGNREMALVSFGGDVTVLGSVIRDTLPRESDLAFGGGIQIKCDPGTGVCGRLRVEGSLLHDNRSVGIFSEGTDASVHSTVVRDTRSQESDSGFGAGIQAQCDPAIGICGRLRVEWSMVAGNRGGVAAFGVETELSDTVVRDSLSDASDPSRGSGIGFRCDPGTGGCPAMTVRRSLVSGNRGAGLVSASTPVSVLDSVVRDSLPMEVDRTEGEGIIARCDPAASTCGRLVVASSLLSGNRTMGLFVEGADAVLRASIVRDTLPREGDQAEGLGVGAQCDLRSGVCGRLDVEGSLVTGNRTVGLLTLGMVTSVEHSTVRDTGPRESDQASGWGIGVQCFEALGICGSLDLEDSLVKGNRQVAIHASGVAVAVRRSVIRDTLPEASSLGFGRGIGAQCDTVVGACGSLSVEETLLERNQQAALISFGVETTARGLVIRDTLPQAVDQAFGRGINVQCDPDLGACGSLSLEESLVLRSENGGIYLSGVSAQLRSVVVLETVTNAGGPQVGESGQGIWAQCDPVTGACGTLSIDACRVASSHGAGIAIEGLSGFLTGSVVSSVHAQPGDGRFGYGVQIAGLESGALPTFHVQDCAIRDARLVGVFYYRARGTLSGSSVHGGEYCVAMNEGSEPTITQDNQLTCTVASQPEWVSLYPSPAPPPATPLQ